jgi:hypothetical protein
MVVPSGITSIPNFIQIRPAVLELNHADGQDEPYMRSFHAHRKERIIIKCSIVRTDLVIKVSNERMEKIP